MASNRSELEQRRSELTRSLPALTDSRAKTYRHNSDALARERAGVKHEQSEEMVRLAEAEVAADRAVCDLQRELRAIEAEMALMPRRGIRSRVGRALGRQRVGQ